MEKQNQEIISWIKEVSLSDSQVAFKSIYLTYYPQLIRFTCLYISSIAEAEEIVSDTFLTIWNNRKILLQISSFNAYVYSIARNKAISHYRKQHMEKVELDEKTIDFFFQTETTPEDELIKKEDISKLNEAINALPFKCKMTFKLIREDGLKYKEVAEILDISIKTVEAHLSTAIKKLRKTLTDIYLI